VAPSPPRGHEEGEHLRPESRSSGGSSNAAPVAARVGAFPPPPDPIRSLPPTPPPRRARPRPPAPAPAPSPAPAPAPAPAACVAATVGGSGANGRRNADGGGSDAGTDEAGSCGSPASSDASLGGAAALGADSLRTTSPPIALSEGEELMRRGHLG
jgi:hypothetical protein